MFSRYVRILSALLCLCLLTACAGPVKEPTAAAPTEAVVESCTAEVPLEPTPEPTPEPWLGYAINSPEMAEETVRAEIKKMQELGLLSDSLYIKDGPADAVYFFDEPEFLDRADRPYFAVRWYLDSWYGNDWAGENRYHINAHLDAQSGKIMYMSIEAAAAKDSEVAYEMPALEYDEKSGENVETEEKWLYHENFYDIFEESMSIAGFCDLLNEYWEFEGWSLAGGGALNTRDLLLTVSGGRNASRYVVFSFEGDEEGKYMYVELAEFPGRVNLMFGTSHSVG